MDSIAIVRVLLLAATALLAASCAKDPDTAKVEIASASVSPPPLEDAYAKLDRRTLKYLKHLNIEPENAIQILVEQGSQSDADLYYARIKPLIGFNPVDSTLDSLVRYLGYANFPAKQVETLSPEEIGKNFPKGEVVVSRFFAPKIVDFNTRTNSPNPYVAGWRRLVRVNVDAKSDAARAGIAAAFILFNYTQPDPTVDPFALGSKQNQVILIPKKFASAKDDSAYFLVYGPGSDGYKIGFSLIAAFDVPTSGGGATREYFLPTACAQCHGHDEEFGAPGDAQTYSFAKLNYLDTDQWYDMVEYDFPATAAGNFDAVFDGGKDHSAAKYSAAVARLKTLNKEIRDQNVAAKRPDGSDQFKIASVEKWISLHATSDAPVRIEDRALSVGGAVWDKGNASDQTALGYLNRYCFRCHGSMYYSVFDKTAVLDRKLSIQRRVRSGVMPQGRTLALAEREAVAVAIGNVR